MADRIFRTAKPFHSRSRPTRRRKPTATGMRSSVTAAKKAPVAQIVKPTLFSIFLWDGCEKIDTVDYTKKSRELKVAQEYAVRLMQKNYHQKEAKQIAAHLVEQYPTHGFVIDREEAESE